MSREQAKALRKDMTDAERRLWYRLRAHRFGSVKFKRQVPIGPFIVDFACMGQKLVIEVDGGQHAQREADLRRTEWLESRGFRVLRFWNNEVLNETDAVLGVISAAVSLAKPSPVASLRDAPPSPLRGEGKTNES